MEHILKYLRITKDMLLIYRDGDTPIDRYTNSNFQLDFDNRKSTSSFVFLMNGVPRSQKSSKQEITTDSTTKVEYVAACDAAKEVVWIQTFIFKIIVALSILSLVSLYCNNNRAITQAKEPRSHQNTLIVNFTLFERLLHVRTCNCKR